MIANAPTIIVCYVCDNSPKVCTPSDTHVFNEGESGEGTTASFKACCGFRFDAAARCGVHFKVSTTPAHPKAREMATTTWEKQVAEYLNCCLWSWAGEEEDFGGLDFVLKVQLQEGFTFLSTVVKTIRKQVHSANKVELLLQGHWDGTRKEEKGKEQRKSLKRH